MEPTMPPTTTPPQPQPKARNKRMLVIIIGVAVVAVAVIVWVAMWILNNQQPQSAALDTSLPVADVSINASGFGPGTVTVKRGQQVTWTNNDSQTHSIAADQTAAPSLTTDQPLQQGDSYTYAFENAGTYHVYDPGNAKGFTGTIVVQ